MCTGKGQRAVVCGREGNRRFVVAPDMRYRLCGISIYWLNGLRRGDRHARRLHFYAVRHHFALFGYFVHSLFVLY